MGRKFLNLNTVPQGAVIEAQVFRPLLKALGLPVVSDEDVTRVVPALRLRRCPTAVAGGVRPVVINSVDSHAASIGRPHVLNKLVRIKPSVAYDNSSAAVSGEPLILSVRASGNHAAPPREEGCSPQAVSANPFLVKATAAFRVAIAKCSDLNVSRIATALALNVGIFLVAIRRLKDAKHRIATVFVSGLHNSRLRLNQVHYSSHARQFANYIAN